MPEWSVHSSSLLPAFISLTLLGCVVSGPLHMHSQNFLRPKLIAL